MDKQKLKKLADYAVFEGTQYSEDGRWSVSYDELFYHFGVEVNDTNGNGKELAKELRQREEISELIMTEDAIEMTYHMEYCENCQNSPESLLSVMGCNIYDEHTESDSEMPSDTVINAPLVRKQNTFDIRSCAIKKAVELSAEAFAAFLKSPLDNYEFLEEFNREGYTYENKTAPCIMVLGEGSDDGVCVETSGSSYARYSAYIPHARQIVEQQQNLQGIKNVRNSQLKKAIFMLSDEFENLLAGYGMKADISYDGIFVSNTENETFYDDENLNKMLSEHFGVKVTSVHADDCDLIGVWIAYKNPEICEQNTESEDAEFTQSM